MVDDPSGILQAKLKTTTRVSSMSNSNLYCEAES
jgi:hypothetical protein